MSSYKALSDWCHLCSRFCLRKLITSNKIEEDMLHLHHHVVSTIKRPSLLTSWRSSLYWTNYFTDFVGNKVQPTTPQLVACHLLSLHGTFLVLPWCYHLQQAPWGLFISCTYVVRIFLYKEKIVGAVTIPYLFWPIFWPVLRVPKT